MKRAYRTRGGFSLLEMVLAIAIGMLLLLALYVAFNSYIVSAQAGRDAVTESALARNVHTRIASDIQGQLAGYDQRVVNYPGAPGSETAPAPSSDNPPAADVPPMVHFNNGVYGTKDFLILSTFRVRKPGPDPDVKSSDMKRIVYWIVTNGSRKMGLARAEIDPATSPDADLDDPTAFPEQEKYIIAPEVMAIEFYYHDGIGNWNESWVLGGLSDQEGVPPLGPPAAIKVTITLRKNLKTADDADGDVAGPTFTNIIALPASNSFPQPAAKSDMPMTTPPATTP
jgi:type II secretory pathway pseudopilin PulG